MARHRRNQQQRAGAVTTTCLQIDNPTRSLTPESGDSRRRNRLRMASKDSGKSTRISLACIACRARKHRCSGEKPRCAQCISNNLTCEWPAQQKRGPPKQYINSLETRLLETETILISLLCHVSVGQLQAAFKQMPSLGQSQNNAQYPTEQETDRFARIRQEVCRPFYWSSFPLDSEENLRRWWEDRMSKVDIGSVSTSAGRDFLVEDPPEPLQHANAFPISEVTDSIDLRPYESTNPTDRTSRTALAHAELQASVTEAEFASRNMASLRAQQDTNTYMQMQDKRRVNDSEKTPASNEEDEGILKLPTQFKLDFVW